MIKLAWLYCSILKGIEDLFYPPDSFNNFAEYLASLKEPVALLWYWYKYRKSVVEVNYSDSKYQTSYLLVYFPRYVQMTFNILATLHDYGWLNFQEEVRASFFGSGPCPEIVGLAYIVAREFPGTKRIIANLYDIAHDDWERSRNITERFIIAKLGHWEKITLSSYELNFCSEKSFIPLEPVIKQCSLFIFQNCLNEIYKTSTVEENIKYLINTVLPGSLIIFADLDYEKCHDLLNQIQNSITQRNDFEIYRSKKLESCCRNWLLIPGILRTNLLTKKALNVENGNQSFSFKLNPRYKVNYYFLAARKKLCLQEENLLQ
jgi:hypothetical protein